MITDLLFELKGAKSIGISGHIKPDGDCIGSCLSLMLYLKKVMPEAAVEVFLETPGRLFDNIPARNEIITNFPKREPFDVFIVCDTNKGRTGDAEKYADAAKKTPFYTKIIPSMIDYYETEHYIFVHGWIPCIADRRTGFSYYSDWRNVDPFEWKRARWYNGMDAVQTCMEEKTILCGHWHSSYGHWKYEHIGSEFGEDADFSPYYGSGIIALDACTAISNRVNVIVLEDNPL